jgi:hypothetical protein
MSDERWPPLADLLSGRPIEYARPLVLEIDERHHDLDLRFALPGTIAMLVADSEGADEFNALVDAIRAEDFDAVEAIYSTSVRAFGWALLDPSQDVNDLNDIGVFTAFRYGPKTLRRGLANRPGLRIARSLALYDGAPLDNEQFGVVHYRRADYHGPAHSLVVVRKPRLTPLEQQVIAAVPGDDGESHLGEDVGFFVGAIVGFAQVGGRVVDAVARAVGTADVIHGVEQQVQDVYNQAVNAAEDWVRQAAQDLGVAGIIDVTAAAVNIVEGAVTVVEGAVDGLVDLLTDIIGAAADWVAHNIFTVDDQAQADAQDIEAQADAQDIEAQADTQDIEIDAYTGPGDDAYVQGIQAAEGDPTGAVDDYAGAGAGEGDAGNGADAGEGDAGFGADADAGEGDAGGGDVGDDVLAPKQDTGVTEGADAEWKRAVAAVAAEIEALPPGTAARELLALRARMIALTRPSARRTSLFRDRRKGN